jgi:hypothetical protein
LTLSGGALFELVNFAMTAIALLRLPVLFLNDTTGSVSAEEVASIAKRQGMGSRLRGNDGRDGWGDAAFLAGTLPSH